MAKRKQMSIAADADTAVNPEHEPVPTLILEFLGHDTFRVTALKQDPMNMWIRLHKHGWQMRYAPAGAWVMIADPFEELIRWADAQTCGSQG